MFCVLKPSFKFHINITKVRMVNKFLFFKEPKKSIFNIISYIKNANFIYIYTLYFLK